MIVACFDDEEEEENSTEDRIGRKKGNYFAASRPAFLPPFMPKRVREILPCFPTAYTDQNEKRGVI